MLREFVAGELGRLVSLKSLMLKTQGEKKESTFLSSQSRGQTEDEWN